jgi:hypothetical protein
MSLVPGARSDAPWNEQRQDLPVERVNELRPRLDLAQLRAGIARRFREQPARVLVTAPAQLRVILPGRS